jgi:hypothetical protein
MAQNKPKINSEANKAPKGSRIGSRLERHRSGTERETAEEVVAIS